MRNPLLIKRLAIRILLLAFAGLQIACASTPSLRPCEAAGCYTTARPAPWPTEVVAGGVALRFHELSMIAPAEFSAINAQPDAIFAKYVDNSTLVVAKMAADNMANPVPEGMNALEWADILFTKTPSDKKRDGALATGAWEEIVLSKTVIIGEGEVTVYREGSLIAYRVSGETLRPYTDDIIIINAHKPMEFYRIGVNKLPRVIVDKILASVKSK